MNRTLSKGVPVNRREFVKTTALGMAGLAASSGSAGEARADPPAPSRNFIANARASAPVIHLDSPLAVAILPSSVMAAFTVTNGVR